MKSSQTPILNVIRRDLQNIKVSKNSVGQMKQKTYFSSVLLLLFLFFFPSTEFLKHCYIYASD